MANATGGMRPSAPQYGPKKKPSATPKPKATKKATPSPKKPSPKPKTTKGPTQRQMLDVANMTPAQKAAYLSQQQRNAY